MNNKALLAVIAILLAGILLAVAFEVTKRSPAEKMADSVSSAADDVGDAISNAID